MMKMLQDRIEYKCRQLLLATFLFCGFTMITCAVSNAQNVQPPSVASLLKQAVDSEKRVKSGHIQITKTIEMHQNALDVAKAIKEPELRKRAVALAMATPKTLEIRGRLVFDADEAIKFSYQSPAASGVDKATIVFTPKLLFSYRHYSLENVEYREEVIINKPMWPPDQHFNILTMRYWHIVQRLVDEKRLKPKVVRYDATTGDVALELKGVSSASFDQVVTFNTRENFSISQIEFWDRAHTFGKMKVPRFRSSVWKINWKAKSSDVYYPVELTKSDYAYSSSVVPPLDTVETYKIEEADINPNLTSRDLYPGEIPQNARVQDNRFSPPLVYNQGVRQYTDEELFKLSQNRSLLTQSLLVPKDSGANGRSRWLVAIGIPLLLFSLFMMRRAALRRREGVAS